jgi:hypothetical protein
MLHAARENAPPLVVDESAATVREDLDLARERTVIKTLMTIRLCPRRNGPGEPSTSPRSRSLGGRASRNPRPAMRQDHEMPL